MGELPKSHGRTLPGKSYKIHCMRLLVEILKKERGIRFSPLSICRPAKTYFDSKTKRLLRGCTGRLLLTPITVLNFSIWASDTSIGVFSTLQLTPSVQG